MKDWLIFICIIAGCVALFYGVVKWAEQVSERDTREIQSFIEQCHNSGGTVDGVGGAFSKTFICN